MIQVSTLGDAFTVLVDGVSVGRYATRQQAIRRAIELREEQS